MRRDTDLEATLVAKYAALSLLLNERARRLWAAAESVAIGYGGDAVVSSATCLSRNTIRSGRRELAEGGAPTGRLRRAGAGRPAIEIRQPGLRAALEGRGPYPAATDLYITADAGGSNGYRSRAWQAGLQRVADDLRLTIHVSHFPPGTSKWNKIEHRLFCHLTENWRGRALVTFETLVELIGNTTTATGLRVQAKLDKRHYKTGVIVTAAEMRALTIDPDSFHGDWNYTVRHVPLDHSISIRALRALR